MVKISPYQQISTMLPIMCIIMVAACTDSEPTQTSPVFSDHAVLFSAENHDTRSAEYFSINNDDDLKDKGFRLWCYYTGTDDFKSTKSEDGVQTIMDNLPTQWIASDNAWSYGTKRYWPTGENKLSFFALAYNSDCKPFPGKDSEKRIILGNDVTTGLPTLTYRNGDIPGGQEDILWATRTNGMPYTNETMPKDKTVHLQFNHALAKISLGISASGTWDTKSEQSEIREVNQSWYTSYKEYTVTETTTAKMLIRNVTVSNCYETGTLLLNNTEAYTPVWENRWGNFSYNFDTDINSILKYHDDIGLDNQPDGITDKTQEILENNKYFTIIPREVAAENNMQVKVTYVRLFKKTTYTFRANKNFWGYYEDFSCINADNPDVEWELGNEETVTSECNSNIIGGKKYNLLFNFDAKYATITLKPMPWEVEEQEITSDNTINIAEGGTIKFLDLSSDVRVDYEKGYCYTGPRDVKLKFHISLPKGSKWMASLITLKGNENAFTFVDNEGKEVATLEGPIGEEAIIHIKAKNVLTTIENRALLRIYAITQDGKTSIIRSLVPNTYNYNEWTLIQEVNE